MRFGSRPFYLAKDYRKEVIEKRKCLLDGPESYVQLFYGYQFSSLGFRTSVRSWKNEGLIDVMSETEYMGVLYFDMKPSVVRIAAQVGLNPLETFRAAHKVGEEHPKVDGEPIIMSTDFVIDECEPGVRSRRAIAVKREADLTERVLEKVAIERESWRMRNTKFTVLLDSQLPKTLIANVRLLHARHAANQLPCDIEAVPYVAKWLTPHLESGNLSLAAACKLCDRGGILPRGTSLAVALHLIARRHWPVDMNSPIAGHLPVPFMTEFIGQN
jgi:hypothetical protein